MFVAFEIQAFFYVVTIGSFVLLVGAACLVLFLVISLIALVVESTLATSSKILWIALAVLLPGISTVLWYFLSPRAQPTDEERTITSNWFAEIGQPI